MKKIKALTVSIFILSIACLLSLTACAEKAPIEDNSGSENTSDTAITESTVSDSESEPADTTVSAVDEEAEQTLDFAIDESEVSLPWALSEPQIDYEETPENSVSFELVAYSLTAAGAEFKITNLSDKTIAAGNDFTIEVFKDGKWNYIDIGLVMFPAEAFEYEAGQTYDVSINWTNYYGELPPSDYRIIKEYCFEGSPDKYYCICGFSIEKE